MTHHNRKRRFLLVFLAVLAGLMLLLLGSLNLPFSQRFVTEKVNRILDQSGVPIQIDAIQKILPPAVRVEGVSISGIDHDTIIRVGELDANCRLISLLRKKVIIREVTIDQAAVELVMNTHSMNLNIAEAFTSSPETESGKQEDLKDQTTEKKAQWEISIREADLSGIRFGMSDSINGIHISQIISGIQLDNFNLSLSEKELTSQSVGLVSAEGWLRLNPRTIPQKEKNASPWNMALLGLSLDDIDFCLDKPADSLKLDAQIGRARVRMNQMDLRSKLVDIKKISLKDCSTILQTAQQSSPSENSPAGPGDIKWSFLSQSTGASNLNATINNTSYRDIELDVKGFHLGDEILGMRIKELKGEMKDGLSVRNMKGEIHSEPQLSSLQMELETGYSSLSLEARLEKGLFEIINGPQNLQKGKLQFKRFHLSPEDLFFIMPEWKESTLFTSLFPVAIDLEGTLSIDESQYTLSGFSLSQSDNILVRLNGLAGNPFRISESVADLELEVSHLNPGWLEDLSRNFGIADSLPALKNLHLQGRLSDSILSPHILLALSTNMGEVEIDARPDLHKGSVELDYSLQRVCLGNLLNIPMLDNISGKGKLKGESRFPNTTQPSATQPPGVGFSFGSLKAGISAHFDTIGFNDYSYQHISIEGEIVPSEYSFLLEAGDPAFKSHLNMILHRADSGLQLHANGDVSADLHELNFYPDTLLVETGIEADFSLKDSTIKALLSTSGTHLSVPGKQTMVRQIDASFRSDSIRTLISTKADFFELMMQVNRPSHELDSIGSGYKNYFASFLDPTHMTSENRLNMLPELNAKAHINHHEAIDFFLSDTGFHFSTLDLSLSNSTDQKSLHTHILGNNLSFRSIEIDSLRAEIVDSAGFINLDIGAMQAAISSGPAYNWHIKSEYADWKMNNTLTVHDNQNEDIYDINITGEVDSSLLQLNIPSRQFLLNKNLWSLDAPELLSFDLAKKTIYSSVNMRQDSSGIFIFAQREENAETINLEMDRVWLNSLIRNDLIQGSPQGNITGTVDFTGSGENEKSVETSLSLSKLIYSGEPFNDLEIEGSLQLGNSNDYSLDVSARLDSSQIELLAERNTFGMQRIDARYDHFPLISIQPFIREYISDLQGAISGNLFLDQNRDDQFGGKLIFEEASLRVNILNSSFSIPNQVLMLDQEKLSFDQFTVMDAKNKKMQIDGLIEFGKNNIPSADLLITSGNLQVMSRNKESTAPFSGNVFIDTRFRVKGPLNNPEVDGKITLTQGTEIYYQLLEDLNISESQKIVRFVDHSEEGHELSAPSVIRQEAFTNSSIETIVDIDPATLINFSLSNRAYDIDLNIRGGGVLKYNMISSTQVSLLGQYKIGEGEAELKLTGWPNKSFTIGEGGYVRWNGRMDNPELKFEAVNKIVSSYINPVDGKRRDVDFNVILQISDQLSDLDVLFTISTPDQYLMSIINTLSPEEQTRQAISVLLFESIDLPGISSSTDYMTQQVNQILSSQLNQLTKASIKGFDISFGLDSYTESSFEGGDETTTNLSYEVRKSLLNNRATIELSGRLKDVNQQPGASDLSLNNLTFEYQLDSAATKYLKVYNEQSFDDVFEGEVIKTGAGFSYRKQFKSLRDIWKRKDD